MYVRQTTYEEVMTLEEARKIIKAETQEKREEVIELAEVVGFFLPLRSLHNSLSDYVRRRYNWMVCNNSCRFLLCYKGKGNF